MGEILVAIDGSKYSEKIVEDACNLATRLEASVTLLYISKNPDLVNEYIEYGGRTPKGSAQASVTAAETIMTKLSSLVKGKGLACEVLLESGNPADIITTLAKQRKSELVAVGLKGLHGIERVRSLGSVSRRVLENSPCPVLVISRE